MIDFAQLETAWRSSANNPSAAASAYLMAELSDTLRERRRSVLALMMFAGVGLCVPLGLFAFDLAMGRGDAIDWSREWAIIPFVLIPFAVLALVWRSYRAHMARHPDVRVPLPETFRALLDENRFARLRIKIIAGSYLLVLPTLLFVIGQLGDVGKMAPAHQLQAGIVLSGALASGAVYMAYRYFAKLAPERRLLEALVRQYQE